MLARLFPNVYEGWLVVSSVAFVIVMIGSAFFYGFGTIFTPVIEEFGWSAAATSFAFSLRSEVQGIGAPFIGYLVDRMGPRKILSAGIIIMSGGMFAMAYMQNIWQFYAAMFVIAIGISSAGGPVGLVATATWFDERRARAMSVMTIGGGISGLFVVLVAYLVEELGWRGALRVMAVGILVLGLLAASNVRARPRGHRQPMDGIVRPGVDDDYDPAEDEWGVPPRHVLLSRAFLLVSFGQAAMGFATTALIVHQIPFLEAHGVSKTAAAASITVFTLTSLVGRLGFGYLADRYEKRLMLTISALIATVGFSLLALVETLPQAIVVLMIIAPGFGGMIPVRPALLADYFGTRYFGTVNGLGVLIMTLGAFGGPWLVGRVVDQTGAYTIGWLVGAGVAALSVPLMFFAREPTHLIERYRPEGFSTRGHLADH